MVEVARQPESLQPIVKKGRLAPSGQDGGPVIAEDRAGATRHAQSDGFPPHLSPGFATSFSSNGIVGRRSQRARSCQSGRQSSNRPWMATVLKSVGEHLFPRWVRQGRQSRCEILVGKSAYLGMRFQTARIFIQRTRRSCTSFF